MSKLTITDIRNLAGVKSASEWRDRIYVNITGNGGNYLGERTSKVWIDAQGTLHVDLGKGMTSREWDANLRSFRAAYAAAIEG